MNVFEDSSASSTSSSDGEFLPRRRKLYRKRNDYFDIYDDLDFFDRFRLTKPTVQALLESIEPLIRLPTHRGGCIKPKIQLLLTLRFYATGNLLITVADFMGVSKSSACRIIRRVSNAIARLRPLYINMYQNRAEMERASEQFYEIAMFPRVIGAIDGTLIRIDSPGGEDAEVFRGRKDFFAINVQAVSDSKLKFKDIIARWPGSTHDQTIFNNSNLKRDFENGRYGRYLLVGDSGYALKPYLMTKLTNVQNEAENLYNESIIRTRNVVERLFGVWKRRFPILKFGMRLKLETTMSIIVATAVLQNIAVEMNDWFPDEWFEDIDENDEEINNLEGNIIDNHGYQVRQLLITEHFARL